VPRASIIWLAHAVNVVRPLFALATPHVTAFASPVGTALRKARLKCACLVH